MLSWVARGTRPGAIGLDATGACPAVGGGELIGEVGRICSPRPAPCQNLTPPSARNCAAPVSPRNGRRPGSWHTAQSGGRRRMLSWVARGTRPGAIGLDATGACPAVGGGELIGEVGPLLPVGFRELRPEEEGRGACRGAGRRTGRRRARPAAQVGHAEVRWSLGRC